MSAAVAAGTPAPEAKAEPAKEPTFREFMEANPPDDTDVDFAEAVARDSAGRFQKKKSGEAAQASAEPTSQPQTEPSSSDGKDPPDAEAAGPKLSPRALLAAGKEAEAIDAALKAALGMTAAELRVDPKAFVSHRKEERRLKAEMSQREQRLAVETQQVAEKYAPLYAAQEAFKSGKVSEAVKAAFGVDWNELSRLALREHHERDPKLDRYEQELADLRAKLEERDRVAEERAQQAAAQQERQQHLQLITEVLGAEDTTVSRLANKHPKFTEAVLAFIEQNASEFDGWDRDDIIATAAETVYGQWEPELRSVAELFAPSGQAQSPESRATGRPDAETGTAAPTRERPARRAPSPKPLSQSGAAEAGTPTHKMTELEAREHFARLLRHSTPD